MIIFRRRVPGLAASSLTRFLLRARRAAGLRGQINVLITGNDELQDLNRRFRGKNQPTDVLSFPSIASDGLAGEIAISAEIASQNARRLGHAPAEEIKILALHGVLHLAGYDHETDRGQMAAKEQRLRMKLGLPSGLIERSHIPRSARAHP